MMDITKDHMITKLYPISSKGYKEPGLLTTALSHAISSLYIIFSLKTLLSLFKTQKP